VFSLNQNAMAVGDFNHDGHLDVALAGSVPNGYGSKGAMSLLLGNGDGTFQAAKTFTTGGYIAAVAVGDLNHDGNLDLVAVDSNNNRVDVFVGNGDGTFQNARKFSVGSSPDGVALGDFNGDGKLDLVTANGFGNNTVSVLLGNGNGTFAAAQNITVGSYPSSVAVADINGDGKADLIVANKSSNNLTVLLGNGDGTFQAAQNLATDSGPVAVAAQDVNGDGKVDLIAANNSSGTVSVLLGNGNGSFQAFKSYSVGSSPIALAVADVNGDGHPDLVTASASPGNVSVLLNNGKGTFAAPLLFEAGVSPGGVAVGDFSGDGKLDLIVAADYGSTASLLVGKGNGTFVAPRIVALGNNPGAVVAGDFNGDGLSDLAVAYTSGSSTISVLTNNGDGTFTPTANLTTGAAGTDLVVGDFNGDGKLDLAVGSTDSSSNPIVAVFLGNGNGTFKKPIDSLAGASLDHLATGDFNGDGKLDLVAVNASSGTVSLLLGNGNGTFGPATTVATDAGADNVAVADLNGDGKPDLVVTISTSKYSPGTASVLLGNGNGSFQAAQNFTTYDGPVAVAVGDVNGDGRPDLITADYNLGADSVSVLLGNGDGTFGSATNYGFNNGKPRSVALADVTGDGKVDIVAANTVGGTVTILPGNGDGTFGTFGSEADYAVDGRPGRLVIGDFNRDGQPDVAVTCGNTGTLTVLLTPVGTNLVINAPSTATAGKPFSVTVSAVDGAGSALPGYTGTVHFAVLGGDGHAVLPADYTFVAGDHGVHTFTRVSLGKAGARVLTVADVSAADSAGSFAIQVSPGAATHLAVSAPKTVTSGVAFTLTVTALDAFGNVATGYRGTVAFSDSVGGATLPGNYTFTAADHGKHSFSVTLTTTGSQTLTAADTASGTIMGTATVTDNAPASPRAASPDGLDPAAVGAVFAADAV
jgi:hypothetical protein